MIKCDSKNPSLFYVISTAKNDLNCTNVQCTQKNPFMTIFNLFVKKGGPGGEA